MVPGYGISYMQVRTGYRQYQVEGMVPAISKRGYGIGYVKVTVWYQLYQDKGRLPAL